MTGKTAGAGQVLVQVADLSTMWAQLEVPEADAALEEQSKKLTKRPRRAANEDE